MRVCLVSNVPDELVIRSIEYPMQRYGELDNAEPVKRLTNHTVDVLIDTTEPRNAQVSGDSPKK